LKNNYAFYIIIGLFIEVVILNFIFLFYSNFKMKKNMFIKAPNPYIIKKEVIKELIKFRKMKNNAPLNLLKKIKEKRFIPIIKNQKE